MKTKPRTDLPESWGGDTLRPPDKDGQRRPNMARAMAAAALHPPEPNPTRKPDPGKPWPPYPAWPEFMDEARALPVNAAAEFEDARAAADLDGMGFAFRYLVAGYERLLAIMEPDARAHHGRRKRGVNLNKERNPPTVTESRLDRWKGLLSDYYGENKSGPWPWVKGVCQYVSDFDDKAPTAGGVCKWLARQGITEKTYPAKP